jgi:hypothetical protein
MAKMNWRRVHVEDRQRRYFKNRRRRKGGLVTTRVMSRRRPARSSHGSGARPGHVRFRLCPYCGVGLNPRNFDRHTTKRCPKRPAQQRKSGVSQPPGRQPERGGFPAVMRCGICGRQISGREADAHLEFHHRQWRIAKGVGEAERTVSRATRTPMAAPTPGHPTREAKRWSEVEEQLPGRRADRAARRRVAGARSKRRLRLNDEVPTGSAVCIDARRRRYLVKGKLYQLGESSNEHVRVWDESGTGRDYPRRLFIPFKVPRKIEQALEWRR